eukprot:3345543-Pleurochrysis_carterae.AAC.3
MLSMQFRCRGPSVVQEEVTFFVFFHTPCCFRPACPPSPPPFFSLSHIPPGFFPPPPLLPHGPALCILCRCSAPFCPAFSADGRAAPARRASQDGAHQVDPDGHHRRHQRTARTSRSDA